jgi:hypothetical protein
MYPAETFLELITIGDLANNILEVILVWEIAVEGDGRGLDSDTTLLLVCTGIRRASFTRLSRRDDTGLGEKGVGKGGLSVIDVSNDGHVAHVRGLVCECIRTPSTMLPSGADDLLLLGDLPIKVRISSIVKL